ncbi:hypothetical protein Arth_4316 (plasmid) [Arthrobacter sp. FB24]|uniref:hypothetical protein n=1 Tax=Arthrobacter sp. (strain FB24) TaxID=290399 RepID=UPI00005268FC|nr:hypothetical protein [Arthrobacter sp. FB24]ABK05753.1 hypothetical protein Arth_4316 [Arthrobacter sp. FB24]
MAEQQKKKNGIVENSIAGAIGGVVGAAAIVYFTAIWTGTISGPTNPAFWQQFAPLVVVVLLAIVFGVPATRRFAFSIFKLLKNPFMLLLDLRVTGKRKRNELIEQGEKEALAEVAERNAKPEAFNIAYVSDSPVNGVDWFLLSDFSGISGSGPMKDIRITAPMDEIVMEHKDGPTIPGNDPADPYRFSGEVTDRGHLKGIDFRVFWRDADGYPRWDFYHVHPSGQPLKGVRAGLGEIKYGELVTSRNINDGSLTVKWASTQQVMGRLVPSGKAWKVELGRRESRVSPYFIVEDELGAASTPQEGVELLRLRTVQEEESSHA